MTTPPTGQGLIVLLEAERERLGRRLAEIDRAIEGVRLAMTLVGSPGLVVSNEAAPEPGLAARQGVATEPEAESDGEETGATGKSNTAYVHEVAREIRVGLNAVDLPGQVKERFGVQINQKQASTALRNLVKANKLRLTREGGPRKAATYALQETAEQPEAGQAEQDAASADLPVVEGGEELLTREAV